MSDLGNLILVGVDGGGTGCRAVVGTQSAGVLGRAEGGRANVASDPDLAIRNIISTVTAAARKAGIDAVALHVACAHLGLAGVMTDGDSARISSALPYAHATVTDDRPTTVMGALDGQNGFLLAVGTGSFIAANVAGSVDYVGGWGFQISDQASGGWLGRAVLKRVLQCHDGLADHTGITRAIFAKFDDDPNAIVAFSMSAKPGDFGSLARDVVSAAGVGDGWAREIMKDGADYLVRGLVKLGFRPGDVLCFSGGLGPSYAPYLPPDFLSGQIAPRGNALDGAFALAKLGAANMRGCT
jgi:glucosamine kinase